MPYRFEEYFETVKSYSGWHKRSLEAISKEKLASLECIVDEVLNIEINGQPHFFSDDWRHYRNFYGFLLDSCLNKIKYDPRVAVIKRETLNETYDCIDENFCLTRSFATPAPIHVMTLLEEDVSVVQKCPVKRLSLLPIVEPSLIFDLAYFSSFDKEGNRLAIENNWPYSLIFVKDYRGPDSGDDSLLRFYNEFFHEDNCLRKGNRCIHEKNLYPYPSIILYNFLDFFIENLN